MEEHLSPIWGKRKKSLFELKKEENKNEVSEITTVDEQDPSGQSAGRARAVHVEEIYLPKPGNWLSISESTSAMQ